MYMNKDKRHNFTPEHVENKKLVVILLSYEKRLILSEWGQKQYKNDSVRALTTIEPEIEIRRKVLRDNGFTDTDLDIAFYNTIEVVWKNDIEVENQLPYTDPNVNMVRGFSDVGSDKKLKEILGEDITTTTVLEKKTKSMEKYDRLIMTAFT